MTAFWAGMALSAGISACTWNGIAVQSWKDAAKASEIRAEIYEAAYKEALANQTQNYVSRETFTVVRDDFNFWVRVMRAFDFDVQGLPMPHEDE